MKLSETKGVYDLVVSLGCWCGPAIFTKEHHLRKNSFPFDWVQSPYLNMVNQLLRNRFKNYMEKDHMEEKNITAHFVHEGQVIYEEGGTTPARAHFVHDRLYQIDSVHDFPMIANQQWTDQYPAFKQKLNKRIQNFLKKIQTSKKTLFIRYEWEIAKYEDIIELQTTLSKITRGPFNLLIIQQVNIPLERPLIDAEWPHEGICFVKIPINHHYDKQIWKEILTGVSLRK